MSIIMPYYYKKFKCSAEKCKDNCCIGWEIDIDDDTYDFYKSIDGEFGKRLKDGIIPGECNCFKLKDERCVFLNKEGLCDIITTLGEDALCDICREHPRYYTDLPDNTTEGGIGLCCEEAARLILTCDAPYKTYKIGKEDESMFDSINDIKLLLILRMTRTFIFESILNHASTKELLSAEEIEAAHFPELNFFDSMYNACRDSISVLAKYSTSEFSILPLKGTRKSKLNLDDVFSSLEELEPINEEWTETLSLLSKHKTDIEKLIPIILKDKQIDKALRNLTVYYVWRYLLKHFYEGVNAMYLCVYSIVVTVCMYALKVHLNGKEDFELFISAAKDYSKQVEYSEENVSAVYTFSSRKQLSCRKLLSFFRED